MDDNDFDVLVIGTSLTESITAAALSKAGAKVLHIDQSPDYGGRDASLGFRELLAFVDNPPSWISNLTAPQHQSSTSSESNAESNVEVGATPTKFDQLLRDSRHYSFSLSPAIIPSMGPLITSLVESGVARYGGFKLLETVGIYNDNSTSSTSSAPSAPLVKTIPASKEDVFKSKELSLIEKRKLMKFLMFAAGEFEESDVLKKDVSIRFGELVRGKEFGLSEGIASAVAFALAHCESEDENAMEVLKRLRRYIRSTGRYGNSPFLVGHYGGAGEIAQGFCRVCAVTGGVYILGRDTTVEHSPSEAKYIIKIPGIDDILSARVVIGERSALPQDWFIQPSPHPQELLARCIAVLNHPISFTPNKASEASNSEEGTNPNEVDTALLVFPPGSVKESKIGGSVSALIAGEASMSCPSGQHVVYISAPIPFGSSPQDNVEPYLQAILSLQQYTKDEDQIDPPPPSYSVFYTHPLPKRGNESSGDGALKTEVEASVVLLDTPSARLPEFGDSAAEESERIFWLALKALGIKTRQTKKSVETDGEEMVEDSEVVTSFWPKLEPEETTGVDEW